MGQAIKIGNFLLGKDHAPFCVAEMSGNHNRSLDRAIAIVDAAADAGAHAIKMQTYTADSMTLDIKSGPFAINDPKSLWNGRTLYDLYIEAATPYEWHKPIMDHAAKRGMVCFSTPFDAASVDFLESLNAPCYKIASFENNDIPLIRKVAKTGKPIIISCGMATESEIFEAVNAAKDAGARDLILLKCTSSYPSLPTDSNTRTIPDMEKKFGTAVGISDHTLGCGVSIASVALGAVFIEKHFTLARADGGVDSQFSMEPAEFRILVDESKRAWQGLGNISYTRNAAEERSTQYRRSLIFVRDLAPGAMVTADCIRALRPNIGLSPKFIDDVMGRKLSKTVKIGDPVTMQCF